MDPKDHSKGRPSRVAELLAQEAAGGGGGGRQAKTLSATPPVPPSLTVTFNKAAKKPRFVPKTDKQRRLIAEMRESMLEATRTPEKKTGYERPVSRQAIERMQKELEKATPRHELTPFGMVTRRYDREHSRKLAQEINRQRRVLNRHNGKAKEGFNRASGINP